MAQINLLKQNSPTSPDRFVNMLPGLLGKAAGAALLVVMAYYGYLLFRSYQIDASTTAANTKIASQRQAIAQLPRRSELLVRQGQLRELSRVLGSHRHYSRLLPELGAVMVKSASLVQVKAQPDGNLSLVVNVPSTQELDRFLQVFDDPKVAARFGDLRIGSISSVQKDGAVYSSFEVKLRYEPALLTAAE